MTDLCACVCAAVSSFHRSVSSHWYVFFRFHLLSSTPAVIPPSSTGVESCVGLYRETRVQYKTTFLPSYFWQVRSIVQQSVFEDTWADPLQLKKELNWYCYQHCGYAICLICAIHFSRGIQASSYTLPICESCGGQQMCCCHPDPDWRCHRHPR